MTALPPYARTLGICRVVDANATLRLPAKQDLQGRPGFIHGGVIASLLEMACYEALFADLNQRGERPTVEPIDVSVDFLRGGLMIETFAAAHIVHMGRRVVNATAEAWQDDRSQLIATTRMHLLLKRE